MNEPKPYAEEARDKELGRLKNFSEALIAAIRADAALLEQHRATRKAWDKDWFREKIPQHTDNFEQKSQTAEESALRCIRFFSRLSGHLFGAAMWTPAQWGNLPSETADALLRKYFAPVRQEEAAVRQDFPGLGFELEESL